MSRYTYNFGAIDQYVFLGGTSLLTVALAKPLQKPFVVFTSQRFLNEPSHEPGLTFEEFLKAKKIRYFLSENITDDPELPKWVNGKTLGISISAPWIFRKKTIDLFSQRLINAHGKRLPQNRGGGGFSWNILQGNRNGHLVYHFVDEGVDSGDLLSFREIVFPESLVTPRDFDDYHRQKMAEELHVLLDKVGRGIDFHPIPQLEYLSTYWPRLSTAHNGFIDWNWSLDEVIRFVHAFSDPYAGAQTFIEGTKVHFRRVHAERNDGLFHPFQVGIVYRKTTECLYVAMREGTLVVRELTDEAGRPCLASIKVGSRFFTPSRHLEEAMTFRAQFKASGLSMEGKKS